MGTWTDAHPQVSRVFFENNEDRGLRVGGSEESEGSLETYEQKEVWSQS